MTIFFFSSPKHVPSYIYISSAALSTRTSPAPVSASESHLGLVWRWRTSASPRPRWRVRRSHRVGVVVRRWLLARLPLLLLRGGVSSRVSPRLSLGAWVQRWTSGIRRIRRHSVATFTVVRIRTCRISRSLTAEAGRALFNNSRKSHFLSTIKGFVNSYLLK